MARIVVLGSLADSLIGFRGPLLREMVRRGHDVFACAPAASPGIRDALSEMGVTYRDVRLERTGMNPSRDVRSLMGIAALCRHLRPEVFLAYTIKPVVYGSLAASISHVPRIFSMITGLGYAFSAEGLKSRMVGMIASGLYRSALRHNARIFFQNPDDLSVFVAKGLLKNPDQAVMINGSGVDVQAYTPAPYPEGLSFLLIARLIHAKGINEYIEAARMVRIKYPHVRFSIAGGLDENPTSLSAEELRQHTQSGVIDYLGKLQDVRPAIAQSSVYVLPSYREGTPRTVLEAMAMARCVITTDAPGCRETVQDGRNGLLVPVRDAAALAAAMEHFIKTPADIHRMGQAGRRIAEEKYDVRKVNAVILDAMELA